MNKIRLSTVLFSTRKMCKFSRTLYNRQLIQFACIPVEFVVCFIGYQNCVKVPKYILIKPRPRLNTAAGSKITNKICCT